MSVSLATKLRWFDLGARAFAVTLKEGAPIAAIPYYVCPLCIDLSDEGRLTVRMFERKAVEAGHLTAEHVPPRSFFGKELILTCARCNHVAGATLDAQARKGENPADVFLGRARRPVAVRLTAGGHTIPALMSTEGRTHTLKIPRHFQRPEVMAGFRAAIHHDNIGDRDIHVNFHADAFRQKHARASWLRSAYLALFAVAGYRYVFDRALTIVRRQIAEPEATHIPVFMIVLPDNPAWSRRLLVRVGSPDDLQCWAVMIGRHAVFLPLPGDAEFYLRFDRYRRAQMEASESRDPLSVAPSFTAAGQSYEFPTRPTFGLPDANKDAKRDGTESAARMPDR